MSKYLKIMFSPDTGAGGTSEPNVEPVIDPVKPDLSKDDSTNGDKPPAIDFSKMDEDKFNTLIAESVNKGIEDKKKEWDSETDRRVTKFVKDNEALKRELEDEKVKQMGAAEKLEYEETQRKLVDKEKDEKYKGIEQENLVNRYILDNSLNPKCRPLLSGVSEDELSGQVKLLEDIIAEAVNAKNQEWMRKAGKVKSGDLEGETLETITAEYEELLKKINLTPKEKIRLQELGDKVQQKRLEKVR